MHKLSEVISMPVYSLFEGIWLGTIIDICVNLKSRLLKGFVVLSSDEENKFFLDKKDIYIFGSDTVILKNVSKLSNNFCEKVNIMNKKAISLTGENCGNVVDIYIGDNFELLSILGSNGVVIPFQNIVNVGEDAIFFAYAEEKINITSLKPKFNFNVKTEDVKVSILKSEVKSNDFLGAELSVIGEDKSKLLTLPRKIALNPNFILGRKAGSTIMSDFGELIIKEGQKITEKNISKAQLHNKIYELTTSAI